MTPIGLASKNIATSGLARATPVPAASVRGITILGATGSIGSSTIDLIKRNPERYRVEAVSARRNAAALAKIARALGARLAVVADPGSYDDLKNALAGSGIEAAAGEGALVEAAQRPADWVMGAISGSVGLKPTLAAIDFGIPERIGSAPLRLSPHDISPTGVLADAIRAAGGDPQVAAGVNVAILDGASEPSFDALLVPGVSLDGFATALQANLWQQATVRTEAMVAGWRLIRLATPPDWLAAPERFAVSQLGQVFYAFGDLTDGQLISILAAIQQEGRP